MILSQGGSVLYVCTRFQGDSSFLLQKLLGGPKISKLGHMHQATPTLGSIYIPHAGGVRPLSMYQI